MQSNKSGKDQESIQSSTTLDPGNHTASLKTFKKTMSFTVLQTVAKQLIKLAKKPLLRIFWWLPWLQGIGF